MKYYLKPHVTDEMLKAVGFYNTLSNQNWFRKYKSPKKYIDYKNYVVSIHKHYKNIEFIKNDLGIWRFDILTSIEKQNYIQDLIDLDYVEVRND